MEDALLEWLTGEAEGIDADPTSPQRPGHRSGPREGCAQARAAPSRTEQIVDALTRLATDNALYPEKFPDGVYEVARDRLVAKQTDVTVRLAKLQEVEQQPMREEFYPVVAGLLEEWDTLLATEKNNLLRKLLRRVALTGTGRGSESIDFHPVWEPNPWATNLKEEEHHP